jgi:hypothetical protein
MAALQCGDRMAVTGKKSRAYCPGRAISDFTLTESSQNDTQTIPLPATERRIRVVLVIRSKLERLGWSIVLGTQPDLDLLGQFGSVSAALAFLAVHPAHVVLIDEAVLIPKDCDALRRAAVEGGPHFVLVARHPIDQSLERSRYAFACDCLLKGVSAPEMLASLRQHSI